MLSYQHAYHAGGAADLHKHMVLAELLARLTLKKRPLAYVETHAGRGLYDLNSAETARTGEAAHGITRLTPAPGSPFAEALSAVRAEHGSAAYPGSPAIARALLRPQDCLTLMELHPAEHAALRRNLSAENISVHHRDGLGGVVALAPFRPRKGLVLIDPSYEVKSEYAEVAATIRRLVAKWPEAVVLVWYPLLPAQRHHDLLDGLRPLPGTRIDEVRFHSAPERGMTGSGLTLINAPHGAEQAFQKAEAAAQGIFRPLRGRGA